MDALGSELEGKEEEVEESLFRGECRERGGGPALGTNLMRALVKTR